jgi:hypothetical protein
MGSASRSPNVPHTAVSAILDREVLTHAQGPQMMCNAAQSFPSVRARATLRFVLGIIDVREVLGLGIFFLVSHSSRCDVISEELTDLADPICPGGKDFVCCEL